MVNQIKIPVTRITHPFFCKQIPKRKILIPTKGGEPEKSHSLLHFFRLVTVFEKPGKRQKFNAVDSKLHYGNLLLFKQLPLEKLFLG